MLTRIFRILGLAGLAGLAAVAASRAAEPGENVVTAEILPGWATADGTYMAGLRLRLAPGWKTYWRAPGDTGVPPQIDWTGSENIASVALHWPRPEVFYQSGTRTIGYKDEVVLPVELTPADPARGMRIEASLALGVCEEICVPAELALRDDLSGEPRPGPIRAALAQRPVPAAEAGVGAVRCTAEPISDGMRLTTEVAVAPLGPREVAVVELADPTIWVAPADVTRAGGMLTAVTDLVPETGQPFALDRSAVRITLIAGANAIDIRGCSGG